MYENQKTYFDVQPKQNATIYNINTFGCYGDKFSKYLNIFGYRNYIYLEKPYKDISIYNK
jgi:hypothetical protein